MSCHECSTRMVPVSTSDFFDDSGYIGFTAWQCPDCGGRMEEIESHPSDGVGRARRIRYPVAA